jgi:hypothetical protein
MKSALIAVLLSLLAVSVFAPAAQGERRVRLYQDLDLTGTFPGQIFFAVVYQDRHGNGKFKPRWAGYNLETQVSCNPGGLSELIVLRSANSPDVKFKERLKKGQLAARFESDVSPEFTPARGDLIGKVSKGRIRGAFNVEDWDPNPGARENCIASGSFSATPCKSGAPQFSDLDFPICDNLR